MRFTRCSRRLVATLAEVWRFCAGDIMRKFIPAIIMVALFGAALWIVHRPTVEAAPFHLER
jgi:hypothetical protein